MFIFGVVILALLLWLLLHKRKPAPQTRRSDGSDSIIYGETPDGLWQGGELPADFSAGGGDFGGGGSSGGWGDDAGSGGDGDSDGGGGD